MDDQLYQYAVKLSAGKKAVLSLAILHTSQETLNQANYWLDESFS